MVDQYLLNGGEGQGWAGCLGLWPCGSGGGAAGVGDGAEQVVAGALDGLSGVKVGGGGRALAEGFEGDAGPEEVFGAGKGLEPFVGRGDIFLAVAPPDLAVGAGVLGGEEAGPVEVEEGAELVAEEAVDPGDEGVGDVDVAEPLSDV